MVTLLILQASVVKEMCMADYSCVSFVVCVLYIYTLYCTSWSKVQVCW